jgi:hypothetical protein
MTLAEDIKAHKAKCDEKRKELLEAGIIGAWMDEPDRVEFTYEGLDCLIVRNERMFNLCGYVALPKAHPFYKKGYNDMSYDVHGGLTYSDLCDDHRICHATDDTKQEKAFWIGFDCAHGGDFVPAMEIVDRMIREKHGIVKPKDHDKYRDVAYVTKEIKDLARQVNTDDV